MFWGTIVFFIGLHFLFWLLAAFSSSLSAGLIVGGVYVLVLGFGTYLYRRCKRNWEWEQGSIRREMEAIRLSTNPKPCYINDQAGWIASMKSAQERRELAALTTRTWHK